MELHVSLGDNLVIGAIFTAVSIAKNLHAPAAARVDSVIASAPSRDHS